MHTTKQVKRLNFTTGITWGPSKWTILKLCIYLMATQKCLVLMAHMELGLFLVSDQLQRFRIHLDKNMIYTDETRVLFVTEISISYQFKESTRIYASSFIWTTIVIEARHGKYGTIWSSLMLVIQMTIMMEISPG